MTVPGPLQPEDEGTGRRLLSPGLLHVEEGRRDPADEPDDDRPRDPGETGDEHHEGHRAALPSQRGHTGPALLPDPDDEVDEHRAAPSPIHNSRPTTPLSLSHHLLFL